jgi:hypothetical protein
VLRKVYIRHREGVPETVNFFAAYDGFRQLGVELAAFEGFGDIEAIGDLGPEVGICGYIGDVLAALRGIGRPAPAALDYPAELQEFFVVEHHLSTMGEVRRGGRTFVKPVEHKRFTGLIWDPADAAARRAVVTVSSDTPVWIAEELPPIVSEYRVFVLDGAIVGVKHYKGNWAEPPSRKAVDGAVATSFAGAPRAYSLDFAVCSTVFGPVTVLIEVNDAFALGCYGLESTSYAKIIAARWEELAAKEEGGTLIRRPRKVHKFEIDQKVWIESPVFRDGSTVPRLPAVVRGLPNRDGKYMVQDRRLLRFIPETLLSAREP